ncbi:NADPH-dependent FMN reductase [Paenibacillus sp. NPDC056579]|uniref:NADPH-dependent FMN reductase n=1 Tax=Paenibacillus sp. NPDC056579 TaxID=3345871 RepID=UPI00369468CC
MKITMIAGSNREEATSTYLLQYIGRQLEARHQCSVTLIQLRELPLPFFSPNVYESDANARYLVQQVAEADGLILASPEYHGSVSGMLKNALDYMNGSHVSGKPVLSVSSAGGPVGVSSLSNLQTIVRNLHGVNCPEWISIGYGSHSFDSNGQPTDGGVRERVEQAVGAFVELTRLLTAGAAAAAYGRNA